MVPTKKAKNQYTSNGLTTEYAFDFLVMEPTDLNVTVSIRRL